MKRERHTARPAHRWSRLPSGDEGSGHRMNRKNRMRMIAMRTAKARSDMFGPFDRLQTGKLIAPEKHNVRCCALGETTALIKPTREGELRTSRCLLGSARSPLRDRSFTPAHSYSTVVHFPRSARCSLALVIWGYIYIENN